MVRAARVLAFVMGVFLPFFNEGFNLAPMAFGTRPYRAEYLTLSGFILSQSIRILPYLGALHNSKRAPGMKTPNAYDTMCSGLPHQEDGAIIKIVLQA